MAPVIKRLAVLVGMAAILVLPAVAQAGTVPSGFQEKAVIEGLHEPTTLAFAPDGRVFVAEKSGVIKVFNSLSDTNPTVFADLSHEVDNFWDRGLLGMALDPEFPAKPYIYVLYTLDANPGGTAPAWGAPNPRDPCPNPPGATAKGCVVTGRLSKLTISGDKMTAETPLDNRLVPAVPEPLDRRPRLRRRRRPLRQRRRGRELPLRRLGPDRQPLRRSAGGVGGSIDPADRRRRSAAQPGRPHPRRPDGARRVAAADQPRNRPGRPRQPLRNRAPTPTPAASSPTACATRSASPSGPGPTKSGSATSANSTWEEIDRVDSTSSHADNFGWPCYEGDNVSSARAFEWDSANLNLCESLYNEGATAVNAPYYSYNHSAKVVPGESCGVGSSSISGLTFYESGPFPNAYNGALFFTDYSRGCIWAMMPGANGKPNPANIQTFDAGAAEPVNLVVGPEGSLYFPDIAYSDGKGKIWRISYAKGNQPPVAAATATPSTGAAPLSVQLSAAGSSDADPGDTLSYSWDLDGDGNFGDSTAVAPTHVYTEAGVHVATVRVSDPDGASDTASVTIHVNNTAPTATITSPSPSLTWAVGDQIAFSGTATDPEDGVLPASAYQWNVILHHCPSNCHLHQIETISGVKSGVVEAPDHEYPSWLEIKLTVTDSGGLTATRSVEEILPKTVTISTRTLPVSGFGLAVDGVSVTSPGSTTVIKGSNNTISAPPQTLNGKSYEFGAWSDGGAATHNVTADQNLSLTAVMGPPGAPAISSLNPPSPANNNSPVVKGTVGADYPKAVKLFANSTCSGPPAVTATPAQFTGSGVTVPVADNTTTALSAATANAAGNSTCSNSVSYTEDSAAPAAPTISGTSPPSPASDNSPEVKGSAEAGATVRVYKTSNCSGTAAATGSSSEFAAGLTVAVAGDATTSLTAQATDAAGNVSACSSALSYTEDSTAPPSPAITATAPASPANDNNPEVKGTVSGSPSSVAVFTTANCSGTPATAPAATFTGAGITVTVPGDQTSALSARAIDAAGNESACSGSFPYTEDSTAPAAPTISSSSPASPANANSPRFTGSAESGATVRLYKSASCGGTAAASGSSAEFAAGLAVAVADDSANQITATATDPAGNVSPCSAAFSYTEDSTPPAAPAIVATSPASPANDNNPEVIGSVGAGSPVSVKVFVNANCSGTAVSTTVATFTGAGVTVTVPGDQTSSLSARAIDAAGNESACSASFSYVEDSKVPPAPTIASSTPTSPGNSASPKFAGSAEAGSTVRLFKSANCSGTAAATGSSAEFAGGLTVAVADDTTTQLTANVTDGAGNVSACSGAFSYTEDSTPPAAPTIAATAPPSPANDNSPEVSGSAAAESTVRIYGSSDCSGQVAASGGSSAFAAGLTVTVAGDSTTPLSATATDAAGNVSGCSAPLSYTEDSTPPAAPSIAATSPASPANSDQPRVSGTVGAGSPVTVEVFIGAGCTGAPVSGTTATFTGAGIAVTVPSNQTSSLTARAVDAAGNESACSASFSYAEDSTLPEAPAIEATTPASPANDLNPAVSGSAPAGSTVRIYASADCSGPVAAAGSNTEFAAGLRLTAPVAADATTQLSATATDAAANVSPCSQPFAYAEDSTAPAAPALGAISPASPANDNGPMVNGSAEDGASVRLYESSDCSGPVAAAGSAAELAAGLTVTVADNTTTAIGATATDAAGNVSGCSAPLSYTEDSTAPAAPTFDSSTPASPANFNNPRLRGKADDGSTVMVYESAACGGPVAATGSAAEFAAGLMLPVADDSENTFSADAADPVGNLSACSSPLRYTEDSTAPQTSITRAPAARAVALGRRGSRRSKTVRASFGFSSDDDSAHFLCQVDGAPFAPCASPLVRGKLKLGSHRFAVYAVDAAGNADPTPASRRFRLVAPRRAR